MESNEDNQNEDRPSAPELLGTSPDQIKRQGEPVEQYDSDINKEPYRASNVFQLYVGIASLILLLLGLIAVGVWFYTSPVSEPEVASVVAPSSLIYTESKKELEISSLSGLHDQVQRLSAEELDENTFSQIFFTQVTDGQKSLISAETLLNELSREPILLGAYLADNFMYGTYKDRGGDVTQYIIFSVTSYDNAYGTMLQTENSVIGALENLGFPRIDEFSDIIVQNQDVRVGGGADGTRLFYSFPRHNRMVITTGESALREIFDRLRRR